MGSTPRMQPVSDEQFGIMLDYMEKHRDLFFGKVTPKFTAQMKRDLWAELVEKLNGTENSCRKGVRAWMQTWNLWKANVKRKTSVMQKHLENGGKYSDSLKALSDVERRCYALILSNNQSYNSDDDDSKETVDTTEKNSLEEAFNDTAVQIRETQSAMQVSRASRSRSNSYKNSSTSVLKDSPKSEEKPALNEKIEDGTEAFTSDDGDRRVNSPIEKLRHSSFSRFGSIPVTKKRLSSAKRLRLNSAKRMRLSAPERIKISGTRKMKATTADRIKRCATEKIREHTFARLQEYASERMKESSGEKIQKYAPELKMPRVEIMKACIFKDMVQVAFPEKQPAPETESSKEKVDESVTKKNGNPIPLEMNVDEEIQNSEPGKASEIEQDIKNNEVKKVTDVVSECLHGTLSGDLRNAIVENLKDITGMMTDVIAEKVRHVISEKVQNDISMKLKDTLSKLSNINAAESNNNDITINTKEAASAGIAYTNNENVTGVGCRIVDVRSLKVDDELREPGKISEEFKDIPTVAVEDRKGSEESSKIQNIQYTTCDKCYCSEPSDMKKEDTNLSILGRGKRTKYDEESSSDEEIFLFPPSKRRKRYAENVVEELRHLQNSRLEILDDINRALETSTCAIVVLSKTIDNNTEAINNLAKAVTSAGRLFLTSFD